MDFSLRNHPWQFFPIYHHKKLGEFLFVLPACLRIHLAVPANTHKHTHITSSLSTWRPAYSLRSEFSSPPPLRPLFYSSPSLSLAPRPSRLGHGYERDFLRSEQPATPAPSTCRPSQPHLSQYEVPKNSWVGPHSRCNPVYRLWGKRRRRRRPRCCRNKIGLLTVERGRELDAACLLLSPAHIVPFHDVNFLAPR
jgi:hypothetical protein